MEFSGRGKELHWSQGVVLYDLFNLIYHLAKHLQQGYDVIYLASVLGMKVTGLDTSQTAVDKALAFVFDILAPCRHDEMSVSLTGL